MGAESTERPGATVLRARGQPGEDAAVDTPKTRYARSADGTFIAYQVFGEGPDLLVAFP